MEMFMFMQLLHWFVFWWFAAEAGIERWASCHTKGKRYKFPFKNQDFYIACHGTVWGGLDFFGKKKKNWSVMNGSSIMQENIWSYTFT